jgi:hypothetical protein
VNWEVWIESGQRAVPWLMAVTFTDRTNFPRVLVEFPFVSVIKPNAR